MLQTVQSVGYRRACKAAREAGLITGNRPPSSEQLEALIAEHNDRHLRAITPEEFYELAIARIQEIDYASIRALPQFVRAELFRRILISLKEAWGL